jgi:iron complex outermembrane recepter protein
MKHSSPRRPRLLLALAAATGSHFSASAIAQSNPPAAPVQLPPVVVQGKAAAEPALTVPSLEGAQRESRFTPGGATVVDPASYETGRTSTFQDLLGFAPGVFVQPRFGSDEARLSIRGSGIQRTFHGRGVQVLLDGVPVNLADGGFDFQAIEPIGLKYTEVFRGSNALQYGGTTLGGSINFVSPTGHDADRARLRLEAGSFGYLRAFGSTGGVSGPVDYYASISHSRQDGFRNWADQENMRFFGNVGFRINADLETRFYLSLTDSDSQLPGSLTKAQLNADPTLAAAGSLALRQKRDYQLQRVSNRTVYRMGEAHIEFGAFYSRKNLDHPIFQVLRQESDDYGLSFRYVNNAPLAGMKNRFVVGFIPTRARVEDNRFRNLGGFAGARTAQSTQTSTNHSLFAENQLYLAPQWAAVLGFNATRSSRRLDDKFLADGDNSVNRTYSQFSPKVGVRYEWSPQIDVYANVSRSFEPPSFGELAGGPNVTPVSAQKGTTFEVGSRGFLRNATWDVSYYRSQVDNELLSLNTPTGQPLGTVNAPRTIHQGVELGLLLTVARDVTWRTSYLLNDFRFDGNASYGDNRLPGIPSMALRSEVLWAPAPGWYVGPTLEWSSKTAVDMANTLFADPFTLWGFKAGMRIDKGASFFVQARNLGNRKYAATTGVIADARGLDSAQFLPGDGRSVFAGIDWRL